MSQLYLVTGGASFIGSHLAEELVKQGEKVRVIDNLSTGKKENIEPFLEEIEFIEGDISLQRHEAVMRDE
ncbi:MAG TPA: NAD-dependent epimerase/dehydratase family protein [Candidatus Acetothermia bacterium]|nr:NAD-dependent epimerase/dehydratase family protein [Candidatus Acetothermia bacterium]